MQFQTQAQHDCYDKIAGWMEQIAAQSVIEGMAIECFADEEQPVFVVTHGSSLVKVGISPYVWAVSQVEDVVIAICATVVIGAVVNDELAHYLLRHNDRLPFGMFALSDDDEVLIKHAFPADACNSLEELALYLGVIALTADEFDDEIVSRWGGTRAIELVHV